MSKCIELEKEDKDFFKEWFISIKDDQNFKDFREFLIKKRSRIHKDWAFAEMIKLQEYYPINPTSYTLEDFNRVQSRKGTEARKDDLKLRTSKNDPKELTAHIINTLFGFILRKEDMQDYQTELEEIIPDINVSQRFL